MSALPKAVRKQIEEANRIAEEFYKRGDPPAGDPPAGGPPSSANPPADPPADPPRNNDPVAQPEKDWEQRYKVLQGKYNAEVPRLIRRDQERDDQVRNLQSQLTTTQNLLASLGAQRGNAPADPPATPDQQAKLVKDEEVKEFGADLIDVMRRVAREESASYLPQEIDRRVAPVKKRVDEVAGVASSAAHRVARNDQQTVLELLNKDVPKWQEQNEQPEFLEWLSQRDPYSGRERGELLTEAYQAHDGPRVVGFFLGFQKEHAAVTPPAPPAAPPAQPQRKLEDFVAPGTPKTGAASTPDGSGKGRVWSRSDIAAFYGDVRAGKYRMKPDEQKKIESDIFKAQGDGRIRA